jgi:uncharacterized protein (TIGR03435 family)
MEIVIATTLRLHRRVLFRAARVICVGLPILWALVAVTRLEAQTQDHSPAGSGPKFEVASIRLIPERDVVPLAGSPLSAPGERLFTMRQVTLPFAIAWAFGVDQNRLLGGPDWLQNQYYRISAKPEGDVGLSYAQVKPLLQQLLRERFHLAYHRETKNVKGYVLVVAKGGAKVTVSKGEAGYGYIFKEGIRVQDRSAADLAAMLAIPLDQPVLDRTGLKENFDFNLNFAPMDGSDSSLPSIFAALEEQLGLKLVSQMVPVAMLVVDHVDRVPTEN